MAACVQCSPIESAQALLDMAEGLEYALSKGMTHRDFKLTNVLMSSDRVAKLVDFGLASLNSTESGTDEGGLRALKYATLEKGTGAPDDDPRSDLYFLGGVVYELLTDSPPYPATKDRTAGPRAATTTAAPRPSSSEGLSAGLQDLVRWKNVQHGDGRRLGSKPTGLEKHAGRRRFDAGSGPVDPAARCPPGIGIAVGREVRMSDRKCLTGGEPHLSGRGVLILVGVP